MFAAMLDTCVLWPSLQRDFLLSLAAEGIYRPLWSDAVLEELKVAEIQKLERRGITAMPSEQAARLLAKMNSAFPDACVTGWEPLEGTYNLPDVDDEHVVAAAVVGGAGVIVTNNLKDFPHGNVPRHIQVIAPNAFAADAVSVSPILASRALEEMVKRRRNPQLDRDQLCEILADRYGMHEAVELLTMGP